MGSKTRMSRGKNGTADERRTREGRGHFRSTNSRPNELHLILFLHDLHSSGCKKKREKRFFSNIIQLYGTRVKRDHFKKCPFEFSRSPTKTFPRYVHVVSIDESDLKFQHSIKSQLINKISIPSVRKQCIVYCVFSRLAAIFHFPHALYPSHRIFTNLPCKNRIRCVSRNKLANE